MQFSIANISFKDLGFASTLSFLKKHSICGIEVAPTLYWQEPVLLSKDQRLEFKKTVSGEGLEVIGLFSLLYNQSGLQLFGEAQSRDNCLDYLKKTAELCFDLGAKILSFGAVSNRKKGDMELNRAQEIAVVFFKELALYCESLGVTCCIEPIASQYGCDFITTADEGAELVRMVKKPNFGLLLDSGSMALNNEDICGKIVQYKDILYHFHANDPYLSPLSKDKINHPAITASLVEIGYSHWVTFEYLSCGNFDDEVSAAMAFYNRKNRFIAI